MPDKLDYTVTVGGVEHGAFCRTDCRVSERAMMRDRRLLVIALFCFALAGLAVGILIGIGA